MIELNVPYTNKFIAEQLFKVKPNTFSSKKAKYLEYLKQFYDYQIINKKIVLRKELKPFRTMMQTRQGRKEQQVKVYRDLTHKVIALKPLNSGSNIARDIDQSMFKPYLNHSLGTIENYVRPVLKEDFEPMYRQWCTIDYINNEYVPLTAEELNDLTSLFKSKQFDQSTIEMNLVADHECGNISDEEYNKQAGKALQIKYNRVMEAFKTKYGFRPYKVPKWKEKKPIIEYVS